MNAYETLSDGTLLVRESGGPMRWLTALLALFSAGAALGVQTGVLRADMESASLAPWQWGWFTAGACGLCTLAVPSGWVRFDPSARRVTWERTRWGRTWRGEADFIAIMEVNSKRIADSDGDYFEVSLRTTRDHVPLLTTSNESEAVALHQAVRRMVGMSTLSND